MLSDGWVVLSAKHSFIDLDFIIRRNCNVTLKRRKTNPISIEGLEITGTRAKKVAQDTIALWLHIVIDNEDGVYAQFLGYLSCLQRVIDRVLRAIHDSRQGKSAR